MHVIHPLKPIYDQNSYILILGSMPSVISREKNFYYANTQNRFWPIMENLFNVKLNSNEDKINFLLTHNIALWDTIKSCDITASSDASIKNIKPNDINSLIKKTNIEYIFCTGKKSYDIFNKYIKCDKKVFLLPSPSSANATFNLAKLIASYQIIKDILEENTPTT